MNENKEICKGLSDNEIISRAREDIKYFACLYDRYDQRLIRYILKISQASYAEASDVLQESFIKVWINLNEFDNNLKLSSWIYRIVHNETVSFCRKKKSFGKDNKVIIDENINIAYDNELLDGFSEEDNYPITENILNSLPLKYREVLVLKFLEKMSYEDISDVLKIPEGTVAIRISRAKKMFKKLATIK
ncbi:RNA polymerase sigma factor [bacterium]|nr:RNA polymerase sigma factor [bacterium]